MEEEPIENIFFEDDSFREEISRADFNMMIHKAIREGNRQIQELMGRVQSIIDIYNEAQVAQGQGMIVKYYITDDGITYEATHKDGIGFNHIGTIYERGDNE